MDAKRKVKCTRLVLLCGFTVVLAALLAVMFVTGRQIAEGQFECRAARQEYVRIRDHVDDAEGIDFDVLLEMNPDTVGWITVSGTQIDYPIVQTTDNRTYLYRTFHGLRNASGSIFLDYQDSPDFSGHVRVYGQHMRDGSMFAGLYGWNGDTFTIHTLDGRVLTYTVVWRGIESVAAEIFRSDAEGILLVTCINDRPDVRLVVWGQLENEEMR